MDISQNGLNLIKQSEGFAATPYNDNGKLAWGYGHDQQPGETPPDTLTEAEAEALLAQDIATRFAPAITALVPASCTQNQFDALCDFAYNLGIGSLKTMLAHGWDEVPQQIPRWNLVNGSPSAGLTARREAEVGLWEL